MVVSTRVSIQWPPNDPQELTNTIVLTTKEDHFVDIRIFKSQYPYHARSIDIPFDQLFELFLVGKEIPLNETQIKFESYISSMALSEHLKTGEPLSIDADVGTFSDYGLDRKETGEMKNSEGVVSPYIEIWRSLDPLNHSPHEEVREKVDGNDINVTLELVDGLGKWVRVGNWCQGIIQDKDNSVHVLRSWFDGSKWVNLIEYGKYNTFPIDFNGDKGDLITVDKYKWKCIEK